MKIRKKPWRKKYISPEEKARMNGIDTAQYIARDTMVEDMEENRHYMMNQYNNILEEYANLKKRGETTHHDNYREFNLQEIYLKAQAEEYLRLAKYFEEHIA